MSNHKYQHVTSKVREYIKEIKETDKAARRRRQLERQQPVCEESNDNTENEINEPEKKQTTNTNSKSSKQSSKELLTKNEELQVDKKELQREEKLFHQLFNSLTEKVDINEFTEVSLVNDSDFVRSYNSTICSHDFSTTQGYKSNNNITTMVSNAPLIQIESDKDASRSSKPSSRKSLIYVCQSTAKKILRKFSCSEKDDNQVEHAMQAMEAQGMRRIHTPRLQQQFSTGIRNTSTPGGALQRQILHSARKAQDKKSRVAFCDENGDNEDRSEKAKRLAQNLKEVADFLETL